jgi:hypothetical protein
MNNLTQETWCQFAIAEDIERNPVSPNSDKAVRWDLWGALKKQYSGSDDLVILDQEIAKLKGVYKILFREKWESCKGLHMYTNTSNTIVHCPPKLSDLNDELDSFEQVKQILLMLG